MDRLRHWTACMTAALALAAPTPAPAAVATKKDLQRIEAEKRSTNEDLARSRQRLEEVQSQLREVEIEVASLSRSAHENDLLLAELGESLQSLAKQAAQQESSLVQARHIVAGDLRGLQRLHHQTPALKALLSGADAASVSRYAVYQRYFARAHGGHVETLRAQTNALNQSQAALASKQQELQSLAERMNVEQLRLSERRLEQQRLVALTNEQVSSKQARVQELAENEKRLRETLQRLALQRSQAKPPKKEASRPIRGGLSQNKGRLKPPVPGPGRSLGGRGVLIEAPEGQDVRAVAGGKVAFADWMRGYGLLLIIDHGSGFMSLYGHNQNLLKSPGDSVAAGDRIASVGNSGGQGQPGLYFELRHEGQPLDPEQWLQGLTTR